MVQLRKRARRSMSEIKDDVRDGVPSASKLGALFLCPGRERLEKGLPDQKSEVASRGNAMHEAMAGGDPTMSHDEQDLVKRMREELVTLKLVVFGEEPQIRRRIEIAAIALISVAGADDFGGDGEATGAHGRTFAAVAARAIARDVDDIVAAEALDRLPAAEG